MNRSDDQDTKNSFQVDVNDDLMSEAVRSVEKRAEETKRRKNDDGESTDQIEMETIDEGSADHTAVELEIDAEGGHEDDKAKEYYERLVRVSADLDNLRKRFGKEKQELRKYGALEFIRNFLPVIDNLERALKQSDDESATDNAMHQGLTMILQQLHDTLKQRGVRVDDPLGEQFNPLLHEAVDTRIMNDHEPGSIVEVHQKGYHLWDKLIRPAMVTVGMAEVKEDKDEPELSVAAESAAEDDE